MAQYRPSFAGYTAGVQPTNTSRPWGTATWEAASDSGALEGKYIRKTSSVQWDYLRFDVVGTADGQFQIRGRFRIPTGGGGLAIVVRSAGGSSNPSAIFFELTPTQVAVSDVNGGTYNSRASGNHSGGYAQPDGTWMWLMGETSSSGSAMTTARVKAWVGEIYDEPSWAGWPSHTRAWPTVSGGVGIFCYQTARGECDALQIGTAGDPAPAGPAAPTATVGAITSTTAAVSGGTFSGFTGFTHAASRFRVRDTSDDTVYGPVLVASASTGPQMITGLPTNTSGLVGEVQYQDSGGIWGPWGTSSTFETYGPPSDPTVEVSDIRRTTVYVTPSAYVHPDGVAHAVRRVRVRRVSNSAIEVAAASVRLSGGFYLTGLPEGPSGAGGRPVTDPDLVVEVQDEDANGLTSGWGASDEFQTQNLWESGEFVTHVDLLIERPEGEGTVMQSYADFGGVYWLKTWKVNPASVDTPIGSATFVLHRQVDGVSLAPLVTSSALNQSESEFAPALDFGREVEFRACNMPKGVEPDEGDWLAGFHWRGITDDIEWPRKTGDITVPARDYSGRLADTMMRTEARYGDPDTPPDAFDVMQEYVDTHMGAGQYELDDLTTGARFAVTEWIPKDVYVWEGLQQVALQWGGKSIRQVDGPTESKVSVIEPDREATTADYAVSPNTYLEVHAVSTDGKNLRPIVRGRCVDSATGEILVFQIPAEEDVQTDPIVDLYGPIMLAFDEDQASAIDTQEELELMVTAAYADVSTSMFPVEPETKFAPFAAVDDMVDWLPNDILWDESMVAAIVTASHSGDAPGVARTRWQCSGRQKGHWREWIRRGVDIAGIGPRPSIFSLTLTHDPVGTLNALLDYNDRVEYWRPWDNVGESPKVDGTPDDRYGQGSYDRPVRLAAWNVRNGVHYVVARAYAGDRFVEVSDTIAILGVGSGSGEIPDTSPLPPFLERGTVDGSNQSVLASWAPNTNTLSAIELEYFIDGVTDPGGLVDKLAGDDADEREYPIGSRITMHARYTEGPGLEGDWSPLSNEVFLPGSLP